MSRPTDPDSAVPPLPTQLAHASRGDNLLRGFSVCHELAGRIDTWSLISLSVGHRRLTPNETSAIDQAAVCASSAEPRIWPLKIVRLASSYGSVVPAIVAGILASDRGFVGWYQIAQSTAFLGRAAAKFGTRPPERSELEAWVDQERDDGQRFAGFGVAFRDRDERADALAVQLAKLGRDNLQHWVLARELDRVLSSRGLPINMGAACAAVLLDIGFAPAQAEAMALYLIFSNYLGNAVEGATQAPDVLRKLPQGLIEDNSPPPRRSPRALAADLASQGRLGDEPTTPRS